jgi:hypothetical protein
MTRFTLRALASTFVLMLALAGPIAGCFPPELEDDLSARDPHATGPMIEPPPATGSPGPRARGEVDSCLDECGRARTRCLTSDREPLTVIADTDRAAAACGMLYSECAKGCLGGDEVSDSPSKPRETQAAPPPESHRGRSGTL